MTIEWVIAEKPVEYPGAVASMESHVDAMLAGKANEKIWLLEHPPLYTAGTSAGAGELLGNMPFPVYPSGRGGRYTYHGPGQRVAYVMMDLTKRGRDVRRYVYNLEQWVIDTLAAFDVEAFRREGRVGIWVNNKGREEKIAAIGVRLRRWMSYHGVAINVAPDLGHFSGIVPCGLSEFGVTSLRALGKNVSLGEVDAALKKAWPHVFEEAASDQRKTA